MKKKYKQAFRPKRGFFSSADEIVEKTSANSITTKTQLDPQTTKIIPKTSNPQQVNKPFNKSSKAPSPKRPNFAFIDGQNLNKSIQNQGWSLDYKEFRNYLDQKYGVKKAYMFIGMVNTNQQLYSALQDFGYHLVFKPTLATKQGEVKGNVDAEMVLYALTQINQYDQAVIVSGDGDFYTLVQYLKSQGKLKALLVPNEKAYSNLYDTLDIKTDFVDDLREKLEYKKR
jgi:uncharacterized LabA/DUF88 family protein